MVRAYFVPTSKGPVDSTAGGKVNKMAGANQSEGKMEVTLTKSDLGEMERHLIRNLSELLQPLN